MPLSPSVLCVYPQCEHGSCFCVCAAVFHELLAAVPERQVLKQRSKLFYDVRLVLFLFVPPSLSLLCVHPQCEHRDCFSVCAVFHELCSAMPEQHQAVAGMVSE